MAKRTSKQAVQAAENPYIDEEYKRRLDVPVYVVVNPITYGDPEVRHETGAEASDIPAAALPWLLAQGHIRLKEAE